MTSARPAESLLSHIYHERQEPGSMMCAQHALNAILQGHFYDPSQLSQIAGELADHQRLKLGMVMDGLEQNFHVDETGYFSVDVIERALKAWDMNLLRWRPCRALSSRYDHPEREFAFLLNLDSHWVALRGFGRHFKYCFFEKPQWIGDTYLSTFLEQEGYTVFVVELHEDVPPPDTIADDLAEASLAAPQPDEPDLDFFDEDEQEQLQRAIRESLAENGTGTAPHLSHSSRRRPRQERSSSDDDRSTAPIQDQEHDDAGIAIPLPPSGRRTQRKTSKVDSPNTSIDTQHARSRRRSRNRHSPPSTSLEEDISFYSNNTHSSPFLHPSASLPVEDVDDDVLELSEAETGSGNQHMDPVDIDDEQMQAVIAASLGHEYSISQRVLDGTQRALRMGSSENPERATKVPDDVERIRRLRAQGDQVPAMQSKSESVPAKNTINQEPSDDEEEEENHTIPSPEEMRRLRLARFG